MADRRQLPDPDLVSALLGQVGQGGYPILNPRQNRQIHDFPVDILDEEKFIRIYAELPGVNKEDITVNVYNNQLTIIAEKNCPYENPSTREIKYGRKRRVINLPICVTQRETVSTILRNGILRVTINKQIEERNRFSVDINEDPDITESLD